MSLIAEREVKFADIEAGFHDKLARLPKQIAAAQHWVSMRAQAAQRFQLLAACLRSLKLNAMANAVLKDRKQFLVLWAPWMDDDGEMVDDEETWESQSAIEDTEAFGVWIEDEDD